MNERPQKLDYASPESGELGWREQIRDGFARVLLGGLLLYIIFGCFSILWNHALFPR